MADQKISQLTAYTTPIATDILPIVDVTADGTKKIAISDLKTSMSGGAITPTTVNGVPVSLGYGSLPSNIAIGSTVLGSPSLSGIYNTATGYTALSGDTTGAYNTAYGATALSVDTIGGYNTAFGTFALESNVSGSYNTALGYASGDASTGSSNVFIGAYAGRHSTESSVFYLDDQDRGNGSGTGAEDKAGALLYGTFNATPASQTLKINGTLSATAFGTINGNTITAGTGTITITGTKTLTVADTASVSGTNTGDNATNSTYTTLATTIATANTWTATQTEKAVVYSNNAITASGNAATVPITYRLNTVTNNSAATLTITMTTTSAVDGQPTIVRILDSSAAAQTLAFVNTENSTVAVPTTSNGSTTLPVTVGFMYNNATSKWRCVAVA